ncbi:hypothetical protein P9847_11525 [Paenibacillus chibensis]|uniref:Phage portal protein n=1 Tax=Paenibacillus chibensis TaxID=59846 RepID=A0ABU6PT02_9BACL|nr:hypothetical protein [Paenibacillus chibensis]
MSNHDRNVKLTLKDLIAKKAAKQAARNWSEEVFIDSLEGEITVSHPGEKIMFKTFDMVDGSSSAEDAVYANAFVIYHAVKLFQSQELMDEFDVKDNVDIVRHLLTPVEINELAQLIMERSGFAKGEQVKEKAKNS